MRNLKPPGTDNLIPSASGIYYDAPEQQNKNTKNMIQTNKSLGSNLNNNNFPIPAPIINTDPPGTNYNGNRSSNQYYSDPKQEPSVLEFKLQKLLQQSVKRQQQYQEFIKKKQEQTFDITEKYLKGLQKYKEQLELYRQERNNTKKQRKFEKFQSSNNKVIFKAGQRTAVSKYKKTKLQHIQRGLNTPFRINLKCCLSLVYFSPIIDDYLKQKFPTQLAFVITLPTKQKYLLSNQQTVSVINASVKVNDEEQNVYNLINNYPFQLYQSQKDNDQRGIGLNLPFSILSQEDQCIQTFQNGKIWISIYDKNSQIQYAYGSFPTEQFLYYLQSSTPAKPQREQWSEAIQFYSAFTHQLSCHVHFQMQTQPIFSESNSSSSKIQSNEPLQLASIKIQNSLYGDKESRMLQRIYKFKKVNDSLLMSVDPLLYKNTDVDKQRIFQNSNDKTLIMHRKMKEIDSINKYKEQHKTQYMSKILGEALQKYSLQDIQIGIPKYLIFYYQKPISSHQKVFVTPQLINCQDTLNDVIRNCQLTLIRSQSIINKLRQKKYINIKNGAGTQIEGSSEQGLFIFDQTVAFIYKVLLKPSQTISQHLMHHDKKFKRKLMFEVKLKIQSQIGQLLSQQIYKMAPIRSPSIQYQLTFHNYEGSKEQIQIPLNIKNGSNGDLISNQSKIQLIASHSIQSDINAQKDVLCIKAEYRSISTKQQLLQSDQLYSPQLNRLKSIDIILIDNSYNFVLGRYRINLVSYHKMEQVQLYQVGELSQYKFTLAFDDKEISSKIQKSKHSSSGNFIGRVAFYSSHPNHCDVLCQGKNQLLCEKNKIYQVQATYQSFTFEPKQQRVVVQAVVLPNSSQQHSKIIKKWLLVIPKKIQDYKQKTQLHIKHNSQTIYKYKLKNSYQKQRSFKFYSSNHSILTVPQSPVILSQMQDTLIQLQIIVRKEDISEEIKQKGINVIMRVQSKAIQQNNVLSDSKGWNQLFKLILK